MRGGAHLYVMQMGGTGAFKVGRSSNPTRRRHEIQTGAPYEVRIILVAEGQGWRERKIHHKLRHYRTGSFEGEWFREPGLGELPDDLYERLDLDEVNTWWEGVGERPGWGHRL